MSSPDPPFPPADPARRALACAFDVGCWLALASGVQFLVSRSFPFGERPWFLDDGLRAWAYVVATVSLPLWLLLGLTETGVPAASPGKRLFGLSIVDARDGGRLPRGRAWARVLVKVLPWEATAAVACLPEPIWKHGVDAVRRPGFHVTTLLVGLWTAAVLLVPRHRGVHDLLAASLVVDARPRPRREPASTGDVPDASTSEPPPAAHRHVATETSASGRSSPRTRPDSTRPT